MNSEYRYYINCCVTALSADPNQTVQAFIDLCMRHEDNFYKFVHEVHIHDNGLFDKLMGWLEGILQFLRNGPGKSLDMNYLFQNAVRNGLVNETTAKQEMDSLIEWHTARKRWHEKKTRQKMASSDAGYTKIGADMFKSSDFGIDQVSAVIDKLSWSFPNLLVRNI